MKFHRQSVAVKRSDIQIEKHVYHDEGNTNRL